MTFSAGHLTRSPVAKDPELRLPFGSLVRSAVSGRQYRIGALLGSGGFGAVYRIAHVNGGTPLPGLCVLKVTLEVGAWHREAYFGELLRETPGIVGVHESFAWVPRGEEPQPLYCLVSEFVEGGDLSRYLQEHSEPWTESKARREIVRLLGPLRLLHAQGLVHRDITPQNVFVTARRELKLGDFGIAAQRLGKHEAKANAFAPWFAPTAIKEGRSGAWLPADDVYHVGKLFALLLLGGGKARLTARQVKALNCSPWAKAVIQRCIGKRRRRFASASEMLKALEKARPGGLAIRSAVRSLQGKRVVFTGRLKILRKKAALLVKQAGGVSQAKVSRGTDIVVVGERSPHWKAEVKGQKLLDLDHEGEQVIASPSSRNGGFSTSFGVPLEIVRKLQGGRPWLPGPPLAPPNGLAPVFRAKPRLTVSPGFPETKPLSGSMRTAAARAAGHVIASAVAAMPRNFKALAVTGPSLTNIRAYCQTCHFASRRHDRRRGMFGRVRHVNTSIFIALLGS